MLTECMSIEDQRVAGTVNAGLEVVYVGLETSAFNLRPIINMLLMTAYQGEFWTISSTSEACGILYKARDSFKY